VAWIDNGGAQTTATILPRGESFKNLCLIENKIGDGGARANAEALPIMPKMRYPSDISSNKLMDVRQNNDISSNKLMDVRKNIPATKLAKGRKYNMASVCLIFEQAANALVMTRS